MSGKVKETLVSLRVQGRALPRLGAKPQNTIDSTLQNTKGALPGFSSMKKMRRAARELALNIIYQTDSCSVPFEEALETALEFADLSDIAAKDPDRAEEARDYARLIAVGIKNRRQELDGIIARFSRDWPIERQPAVDRNILRIAIYEILYIESVPPVVAVDEAVEMAKKYSTAESGKFVNGVLAGFLREHELGREDKEVGSEDS